MEKILSQVFRKPSNFSEKELIDNGWKEAHNNILTYLKTDDNFQVLLKQFEAANNNLKYLRSINDVKIYFVDVTTNNKLYTYARCVFEVDGKRKEFRKYIGKTSEVDLDKQDMEELKKIFLKMLKNFVEQ